MKLRDLPIKPDTSGGNDIVEGYLKERGEIKTTDNLKTFVSRWKAVWDLDIRDKPPITPEEQSLVDGTFDAEVTLKCFKKCTTGHNCKHVGKSPCAGMHVAIPYVFTCMSIVAHKYGAPEDIVLIQLCGGFRVVDP